MVPNRKYLEELWASICTDNISSHNYRKISSECLPDLGLGLSSNGDRCLVLVLPRAFKIDLKPIERENLSMRLFRSDSIIVIELKNKSYSELFSDLVVSLYQSISHVSDVSDYSSILIAKFQKWSQFFSRSESDELSDDDVKGLLGELLVLRKHLVALDSQDVDECLLSWKGPYDKGKDFELDDKDIEVKTKNHVSISVKISSEHQLDPTPGKCLEMWVVSVLKDLENGIKLADLINEVHGLVVSKMGDVYILRNALWQKGITLENSDQYDHYAFTPKSLYIYKCTDEDFPSLIASRVDPAISSVRYSLNLSLLSKFIVSEEEL